MRRCSDLGVEMGKQKRCKEIMNWARKKRRMIRREDLLAYLAGKPPPPRSHPHRFIFTVVYAKGIINLDYCVTYLILTYTFTSVEVMCFVKNSTER